ncbi:MAG: TRAP transporter small permease [Planctomycetota bacterium]|nr:TRAP transporter small permease [Planctomycetota bacterium]
MLKKTTRILYKIVEALSVFFVFGMVGTVCYVVFTRYVMNNAPRWGEEVALLCMVWFSLLSASMAIWDNRHIRVAVWEMVLPKKVFKALEVLVHVILFGIVVLMCWYGLDLLAVVSRGKMSGTGISYFWLYVSIPVSTAFMLIATMQRIGEILADKS